MCVTVTLRGGLGNNLFQYALGRIVAEHHGLALHCIREPAITDELVAMFGPSADSGPEVSLESAARYFADVQLDIPGTEISTPVDDIAEKYGPEWGGQTVDLAAMLADPAPRQIRLLGFFQRYEYFDAFEDRIRSWFRISGPADRHAIRDRDVLVNIRRGFDYGLRGWTLATTYYTTLLERLEGVGRVYVCGTCIDERVRTALSPYDPIYVDGTPMEHFSLITRFNRIILSNSTFAWWAAYLSRATEIYSPTSPDGRMYAFTGWRDVYLHTGEPRFREVKDVEMTVFTPVTSAGFVRPCSASSESDANFLSWLAIQPGPVSLDEVNTRCKPSDVAPMLRRLIGSGLVKVAPAYRNDYRPLALGLPNQSQRSPRAVGEAE
jgi:hypothetical protein